MFSFFLSSIAFSLCLHLLLFISLSMFSSYFSLTPFCLSISVLRLPPLRGVLPVMGQSQWINDSQSQKTF